jgi:hypothetical protein
MGGLCPLGVGVVAESLRVIKCAISSAVFSLNGPAQDVHGFLDAQQTLYKLPQSVTQSKSKWTQLLLRDGFRTPWPV